MYTSRFFEGLCSPQPAWGLHPETLDAFGLKFKPISSRELLVGVFETNRFWIVFFFIQKNRKKCSETFKNKIKILFCRIFFSENYWKMSGCKFCEWEISQVGKVRMGISSGRKCLITNRAFIFDNYKWAERTKFLLGVLYRSPWRHSNSSKTFEKNRKNVNKLLSTF